MSNEAAISGMFGRIVNVYDPLNRILSLGIDQYWRGQLAAEMPGDPGKLLLDLAAGTLDVSLKMAQKWPRARICALDFCMPMLRRGRKKLRGQNIRLCAADARALPLPDNVADGLAIAFGIRNITPRPPAFAEMLRVLRPGGKAVILEFGSGGEPIWGGLYNIYLNHFLPRLGRLVASDKSAYDYLARTIRKFPPADILAGEMREAGFARIGYRRLTGGIVCLHWGFRPEGQAPGPAIWQTPGRGRPAAARRCPAGVAFRSWPCGKKREKGQRPALP